MTPKKGAAKRPPDTSTDKQEQIKALQVLMAQAIEDHGHAMDDDFLEALALDLLELVPVEVHEKACAIRIAENVEIGVRLGLLSSYSLGFDGIGQAVIDGISRALEELVTKAAVRENGGSVPKIPQGARTPLDDEGDDQEDDEDDEPDEAA